MRIWHWIFRFFTGPIRFFTEPKRAQEVAFSIYQLIHMLSAGREHHGPKSPERLLRGLGQLLRDEKRSDGRWITFKVPMTVREAFEVTLVVQPNDEFSLLIFGNETYGGFSLTCKLPANATVIDLQDGATWRRGRMRRYPATHQAQSRARCRRGIPDMMGDRQARLDLVLV
jgi:hypothetical protein